MSVLWKKEISGRGKGEGVRGQIRNKGTTHFEAGTSRNGLCATLLYFVVCLQVNCHLG